MTSHYQKQASIVLLIASIQMISLSSSIVSYYTTNHKTQDGKYQWSLVAIYLGSLAFISSILGFYGYSIPILYQIWVQLMLFLTLIITVIALVVFGSSNGWTTTGWVLLIVSCIVLNAFGTNATLPLSPVEEYKPIST